MDNGEYPITRCECEFSITYDMGDSDEFPGQLYSYQLMTGRKGWRVGCPYCGDLTPMYAAKEQAIGAWNEWKQEDAHAERLRGEGETE